MDATGLRVSDIMTKEPTVLQPDHKVLDADWFMKRKGIRHFPVVDGNGSLRGVVSHNDIVLNALVTVLGMGGAARERLLGAVSIKEVMTENVVTTIGSETVVDAAKKMIDNKIGCLPVMEEGRLVGILSETDLVRLIALSHESSDDRSRLRCV